MATMTNKTKSSWNKGAEADLWPESAATASQINMNSVCKVMELS